MAYWEQAYSLSIDDKSPLVRILKRLLQSHPCVSCRLTSDDNYDAATAMAVASLQKTMRCKNTSGSMDWETWAALGTMQLPIALHHATSGEPLLRDLPGGAQRQGKTPRASQSQQIPTTQDVYAGRVKYTDGMRRCDERLAALFGEPGAYMAANSFDFTKQGHFNGKKTAGVPQYRGDFIVNGKVLVGHLSNYAAHLYGSKDGSRKVTKVYAPWYEGIKPLRIAEYVKIDGEYALDKSGKKEVRNTIDLIYYKKLVNLPDVTLVVLHINRVIPQRVGDRLLLGTSDGPGGDGSGDDLPHVHLEVLQGRKTNLPAKRERIPFNKLCA